MQKQNDIAYLLLAEV